MKHGIMGLGFVGGTLADAFGLRGVRVDGYDPAKPGLDDPGVLAGCDVVHVCVPTPMGDGGRMDSSCLFSAMETLETCGARPLCVVLRSTMVPGTTDALESSYSFKFATVPEFLREVTALQDFIDGTRTLIGTRHDDVFDILKPVFEKLQPRAEIIHCLPVEAEMLKHASNSMLASQITIANEISSICGVAGVDYDRICEWLLGDPRMARNIRVPGPDGRPGFGGHCFPKDVNALVVAAEDMGYSPDLLREVLRSNGRFREAPTQPRD